ncbi:MAG: hypothetical protein FWG99_07240 [Treponema sp.]|nr:hypothetical protein [Treponema sp.]
MRKFFYSVIISALCISAAYGQNSPQPWWYSLERGKLNFRNGDYGSALLSFEDARRQRRAMYEQMERDFINFLSTPEARRIGDALDWLERFICDRFYTAAAAALEELYYRVPKASLDNSALKALEAIGRLKDYPEAEYWIGETYRADGELSLALSQFQKAYAQRELLENSGFDLDLQYRIAGIHRTRQEYNEMERTLLSIISSADTLWTNSSNIEIQARNVPYVQASASFAAQAMTRTLENDGPSRFLSLYRYDNNRVEEAHRLLGFYYAASGRPSAQQHLTFSFLIQNSIIISEIIRRQYDFTFTTFDALTEEINSRPMLLSYIEEVEYYKTIYYLAASLYRNGKSQSANGLWTFLAGQSQAGEWRTRSLNQLRSPRLEPIVEMP